MYTTRQEPVFNNMMYPYRDWQHNEYQMQYMMDDETDDIAIANTIKRISKKQHTNEYSKKRQHHDIYDGRKNTVLLTYNYNEDGYPLDDLDDMYMDPLKYYGKGFNCKTMSPTKD